MKHLAAMLAMVTMLSSYSTAAQNSTQSRAQPIAPSAGKRASLPDRDVLEALLLNVAADKDFPAPAVPEKPVIVLHQRNPESVGKLINMSEVSSEKERMDLPNDAW